ncbi:MAG TPA: hypothetical protein VM451_09790 [Candidatus Limnocylindria bacterium]|nr:hypothetical protein [Candidatus Limnocylindria bacterium]
MIVGVPGHRDEGDVFILVEKARDWVDPAGTDSRAPLPGTGTCLNAAGEAFARY